MLNKMKLFNMSKLNKYKYNPNHKYSNKMRLNVRII